MVGKKAKFKMTKISHLNIDLSPSKDYILVSTLDKESRIMRVISKGCVLTSLVLFSSAVFAETTADTNNNQANPSAETNKQNAEALQYQRSVATRQAQDTEPKKVYEVKTLPDYQENLKLGAGTTKQNYLNDPFKRPTIITPGITAAETWPIHYNRAPLDRSPKDKSSKIVTLGTGTPMANTYRFGPANALIVNGYPYFVDCGEGWFRAINRSILTQKNYDLSKVFVLKNFKYMFLTHLHEDHTVGLPSFILGPYKWGATSERIIYGPKGTFDMITNIEKAWTQDVQEMVQGSTHTSPEGGTAMGADIDPAVEFPGAIYEDDNVKVEAFRTSHGALRYTYAYRFTTKPDNRVIVFGGDGHYSKGLVEATKGADVLVIEGFTWKNLKDAPWGGDDVKQKAQEVSPYHMFPQQLKLIQDETGVKEIVMTHEQNYSKPDNFDRLGLLKEMQAAGVKNIYSAMDGDLY